jgi:hypothetical protein
MVYKEKKRGRLYRMRESRERCGMLLIQSFSCVHHTRGIIFSHVHVNLWSAHQQEQRGKSLVRRTTQERKGVK